MARPSHVRVASLALLVFICFFFGKVTSFVPTEHCSDYYYYDGPCDGPGTCCTDAWCRGVCRKHYGTKMWGSRCYLSDTCECKHSC